MSYDVGDDVTVYAVFRDVAGEQAAPTAVTLHVRDPLTGESSVVENEAALEADLTAASSALGETLEDATGLYKATITPTSSGVWRYAWIATGGEADYDTTAVAADRQERWFDVRRQQVPAVSS